MLNQAMVEELVKISDFATKKGYFPANAGNISARVNATTFVIVGSQADKSALIKEDFVVCDFALNVLFGHSTPCPHSNLHALIYALSPYTNCILHTASKAIWVLTRLLKQVNTKKLLLDNNVITLIDPGTEVAAQIKSIWQDIANACAFIVPNIGLFCFGQTVLNAKQQMEKLEFLADCELTYLLTKERA